MKDGFFEILFAWKELLSNLIVIGTVVSAPFSIARLLSCLAVSTQVQIGLASLGFSIGLLLVIEGCVLRWSSALANRIDLWIVALTGLISDDHKNPSLSYNNWVVKDRNMICRDTARRKLVESQVVRMNRERRQ